MSAHYLPLPWCNISLLRKTLSVLTLVHNDGPAVAWYIKITLILRICERFLSYKSSLPAWELGVWPRCSLKMRGILVVDIWLVKSQVNFVSDNRRSVYIYLNHVQWVRGSYFLDTFSPLYLSLSIWSTYLMPLGYVYTSCSLMWLPGRA